MYLNAHSIKDGHFFIQIIQFELNKFLLFNNFYCAFTLEFNSFTILKSWSKSKFYYLLFKVGNRCCGLKKLKYYFMECYTESHSLM